MPHPPLPSAPSRNRRPSERSSRPSSLSGRGLQSTYSSARRSPNSPAASLPHSPSPTSNGTSPTTNFAQVPRTNLSHSQTSHPDALDEESKNPFQATEEDEHGVLAEEEEEEEEEEEDETSPPDLHGPEMNNYAQGQDHYPPLTAEQSSVFHPVETGHPQYPAPASWSSPRGSPTVSRPPLYPLSPQPPTPAQYPAVPAHYPPSQFQAYHSPGPFFAPHLALPQYYPVPPSVPGTPQGTPSRASFSPHYAPAVPYPPTPGPPVGMTPVQVPALERQASVGSRASASADAALPGSPLGSVASVDRGPAPESVAGDGAAPTEEPGELLQRIQRTITNMAHISAGLPDLDQLLSRYRETHGQLGHREEIIRKAEAQQAEALKQKEQHIDALTKQLQGVIDKHSAESNKLRLEVGNLEEKEKELLESQKELKAKESELLLTLEFTADANVKVQKEKEAVEKEMEALKENFKKEKEDLVGYFDDQKRMSREAFDAEKIAMTGNFDEKIKQIEAENEEKIKQLEAGYDERIKQLEAGHEEKIKQLEAEQEEKIRQLEAGHEGKIKELEAGHEEKITQLEAEHGEKVKQVESEHDQRLKQVEAEHEEKLNRLAKDAEEKLKRAEKESEDKQAELTSKFLQEKKALRNEFAKEKAELESKLLSRHDDLQDGLDKERDRWQKERADLLKGWQEERDVLTKECEAKCKTMAEEHLRNQQKFQSMVDKLEADLKEAQSEKDGVMKSKDDMRQGWDDEKAKLESAIADLQGVAETLDKEKAKLQKMVETFGEITDLKSKGDAYYIDAFRSLAKHIVDLSHEVFAEPPTKTPPGAVLAKIPAHIPSFLGEGDASRALRAAYIQHFISQTLYQRIFHPFLFCAGSRYAKADSLFQSMSDGLRKKSTRKEAVWRHNTLYAAYTSPTAKKMANLVATSAVTNIVRHIKHFAEPSSLDLIYAGVRKIVKIAVETWRYARLEREMISAQMPPAEDPVGTGDEWHCRDHKDADQTDPAGHPRQTLLRLLPSISREPIHESLRAEDQQSDQGQLYCRGVTLCSQCPAVQTRRQELQAKTAAAPEPPVAPVEAAGASPSSLPPGQGSSEPNVTPTPPPAAGAETASNDDTDDETDDASGSCDDDEDDDGDDDDDEDDEEDDEEEDEDD